MLSEALAVLLILIKKPTLNFLVKLLLRRFLDATEPVDFLVTTRALEFCSWTVILRIQKTLNLLGFFCHCSLTGLCKVFLVSDGFLTPATEVFEY